VPTASNDDDVTPRAALVTGDDRTEGEADVEYDPTIWSGSKPGEPDEAALAGLSAATDGRGAIDPTQAFDAEGLDPGRARIALAGWFLLLWPIAAALNRLAPRGAGVDAVRRRAAWVGWATRSTWSRRPGRPSKPPRPVTARELRDGAVTAEQTATVARLLDRKRERRSDDQPRSTPRS